MIVEFLQSGLLPTVLLLVRAVVPLLALYVVWRCYTSVSYTHLRAHET